MKKALMLVLVACFVWPASAVADPANGQDKQNAARACNELRSDAGLGQTVFAQTYRNFGACVSKWTQEAHQNRHQAEQECASEPRQGGKFTRCVNAKLRAEASTDVLETENAARTCKAQRKNDPTQFAADHGTAANAFGKCVSKLASQKDALSTP